MHVSLPKHLEDMVLAEVKSGMYGTASEVVREALRFFFHKRDITMQPSEIEWLRTEMGRRLDALQRGEEKYSPAGDVFNRLDARIDAHP
jgi:antitoxin ParD1/3/4